MIKLKKLNKLTLILAIMLLLMGFTPLMAELFVFAEISADLNAQEVEAEAKLKDLELKISQYREAISENQQKVKSLKTEITIFDDQIKSLELEIQRTELLTKKLDKQINSKEKSIREIEREFDLEKTTLAELAREIRKYDDKSFLEVLLNKDNFSDFIAELKSLEDFNNQVQEELKKIESAIHVISLNNGFVLSTAEEYLTNAVNIEIKEEYKK